MVRLILVAFVLFFAGAHHNVAAQDSNRINLRLFGKAATDGYKGCSFSLWQADRDPQRNKFAYVFFVRFHDAHPMPALVKIGKDVIEVEKQEIGTKDSGLSDKFQHYRNAAKKLDVYVQILKEHREGDFTVVSKARLTFVQRNKFPFYASVKGGFRCPNQNKNAQGSQAASEQPVARQPAAKKRPAYALPRNLDPAGVKLGNSKSFSSLRAVPRHVLKVVRDNAEACNLNNVPGHGKRYAISDAMSLWVVPCDLFTSNASFMLVTALNGTKHAIGMEVPKRPGRKGAPTYDVTNPVIYPRQGVMTLLNMGRQGDCGTLEHYQFVVVEGEAVELKLLEVREKNDCNGVKVRAGSMKLVYRAR